ncbi:hypothetical protein J27TS8_44880 [Robertmurraya siralis]|uniref:G5 domain-containing protein n=1 Tax=Robertmurraya siralis TaxID=77777 RepID=A0A919WM20_9BACI|nr:G5 and 3D domain-containing protein [Robertmurraya siralis]GIN64495.1 hypothetical protein J27TS8_44880 [Robertmurraya siralis]
MKNLFSKSLSKKKLAVVGASFVVFVAAFGFVFYETTKKTVALTLDGQEKIVKTHAGTIKEVLEELDISLHSEDYVSPSADTKVKDNLKVEWKPAKQVQMVKENEKKQVWTTANTVEEFLKEQNVSLNEHDKIQPKIDTEIKNDLQIKIDRAFSVTLNDGGKEKQVWSTSTTVADFLSQQEIKLNELDRVEPNMDETVKEDAIINVIRVEKVTDVVEEPVRFAVVTKQDSKLAKGTEKTVTSGQEGLLKKEYEVVLENGKEVSRKLLNESTLKEKRDQVVAVGTKAVAQTVSRGTNNNVSREFTVSSTAYTANCNGCSGITATGYNLKANPGAKIIAVDPRVIPLGTKVYVEGYGYAIAADTGSAIKGNKIDVFFSSQSAAYRWGRKNVKIKILN